MRAAGGEDQALWHVPVLLDAFLRIAAPITGRWVDGTLGAGGYTRALLDAGAEHVVAIDRDPAALAAALTWSKPYSGRLSLVEGNFANLDSHSSAESPGPVDGVVLDIGVSSMQLDRSQRGFAFSRDGPLDMRMSRTGPTAADIVNRAGESKIVEILRTYGEERAARRIARRIAECRREAPIRTTSGLAKIVTDCVPKTRRGEAHAAARSFQALRIAVNDELGQLAYGLRAADAILERGGLLAVVTFHSLEDRIVKLFMRGRRFGTGNRHAPPVAAAPDRFERLTRKAVAATAEEVAANPRARSAKLRVARKLLGTQGAELPDYPRVDLSEICR